MKQFNMRERDREREKERDRGFKKKLSTLF